MVLLQRRKFKIKPWTIEKVTMGTIHKNEKIRNNKEIIWQVVVFEMLIEAKFYIYINVCNC